MFIIFYKLYFTIFKIFILNQEESKAFTVNLSESYLAKISGYVLWEKNMAGWKVFIDENCDWELQENLEKFTIMDNEWYYEFDNLETWTYKIYEIPHQNWEITNPEGWYYEIDLWNWKVVENMNFENIRIKENDNKE